MNPNHCIAQGMTSAEREALKTFAISCDIDGDIQSLTRTLVMIAHWMRQGQRVSFTEYASQWTQAQKDRDDGNHSTPAMQAQWPFSGKRCISPAYSYYHPQGCDRERLDDETEIRHAVTVILAEYPDFNHNGLSLYSRETVWQHPLDHPLFMEAAKSCLNWIRLHGMSDCKIKAFPDSGMTSYGFKHAVEKYNQKHYPHAEQPHYIPNGAFIAAMVASGYRIAQAGKMNAVFNLSRKHSKHEMYDL
jgi:hypothetical protein